MITTLRRMVTCHWSARRLQRYLDADPSAPLTPGEVVRLESHLAICDKCATVADEHRGLRLALSHWPGRSAADPEAVARLRSFVTTLTTQERE